MENEATTKTPIPTRSGFRNFALCTLIFAFSIRGPSPWLPKPNSSPPPRQPHNLPIPCCPVYLLPCCPVPLLSCSPPRPLHLSRLLYRSPCFCAKQTQFPQGQNQRNLLYALSFRPKARYQRAEAEESTSILSPSPKPPIWPNLPRNHALYYAKQSQFPK